MQLELVDGKGMSITGDDEDGTDQALDVEPIIIATACDASDGDAYVMGSEAIVREHLSYDGLRSNRSYMASCMMARAVLEIRLRFQPMAYFEM